MPVPSQKPPLHSLAIGRRDIRERIAAKMREAICDLNLLETFDE